MLALAWAAYLKDPLALGCILLTLATSGFLIATSIVEEKENLANFGAPYAAYMKHTRRFIPFVF